MTVRPDHAWLILTGQKLVEARLSVERRAPFGMVRAGDIVYIRPEGQRVIARAIAHRVDEHEGLTRDDVERLQSLYADRLGPGGDRWDTKARFATLITLDRVCLVRDGSGMASVVQGAGEERWWTLTSAEGFARAA